MPDDGGPDGGLPGERLGGGAAIPADIGSHLSLTDGRCRGRQFRRRGDASCTGGVNGTTWRRWWLPEATSFPDCNLMFQIFESFGGREALASLRSPRSGLKERFGVVGLYCDTVPEWVASAVWPGHCRSNPHYPDAPRSPVVAIIRPIAGDRAPQMPPNRQVDGCCVACRRIM